MVARGFKIVESRWFFNLFWGMRFRTKIAESSLYSVDSAIISQNGLPRAINRARNDNSFLDSAILIN